MTGVYHLLIYPHGRIRHNIVRSAVIGAGIAVVVVLSQHFGSAFQPSITWSSFFVGIVMSLMIWASEGLWLGLLKGVIREPFSLSGFVLRIPFWYVGSGIGCVIGALTAKKFGFLAFEDIPIGEHFIFGARTGTLLSFVLVLFWYYRERVNLSAKKMSW